MKTKSAWRRHLQDIVGASLDPMIYAVQWARDARCLRAGVQHRRVGTRGTVSCVVGVPAVRI